MTAESSRKTEVATHLAPAGCPRCGTRLGEPYKYCPNCAYRLRPDLFPAPQVPVAGAPLSQRLVALGGYLLFASMLLLVVYAGVRLFARPEPAAFVQPHVMRARDGGCLSLTLDEFVEVPPGTAFWGAYDPGREYASEGRAEAAAEEKEAAERASKAIATIVDETATADEVAEARRRLADEIYRFPSIRDAIRGWKDAFDVSVPAEPVEGMPEGYFVDDTFRMSRREVTNDQYFEFLRAWVRKSGMHVLPHLIPDGWTRRTGSADVPRIYARYEGNFPVVGIPFDAALEFCGWFWEERLGANPDLVVDLPTWKEYILAARGDQLTYNFPWGSSLQPGEDVNLGTAGLWSVVDRKTEEFHNGFLDLVGNAAEWVYWRDDDAASIPGLIVAAGWSYEDAWVIKLFRGETGQPGRLATPFSRQGFKLVRGKGEGLRDVGFRPVIRRAPALPSFVPVTAGLVRHRTCPDGILPPEGLGTDGTDDGDYTGPETIEEIRKRREPLVSFPEKTERVERDFEISATEVTNRQYLAFLADIAPKCTKDDLAPLVPHAWRRRNLFVRWEEGKAPEELALPRAYEGYYIPWERLDILYDPGKENVPVQGITEPQADQYVKWLSGHLGRRCSIPTVAQWLRAARGDSTAPYPWGDARDDKELLPSYRQEPYFSRAFSLSPSASRPIVGFAGNVAELVRDSHAGGRLLLAGGFYDLPPRLVTLDCFLDAEWDTIQYVLEAGDWDWPQEEGRDDERTKLSAFYRLAHYAGLRVVRMPATF